MSSHDTAPSRTISSPRGGRPGAPVRIASLSTGRQLSPRRTITSPREAKRREADAERERLESLEVVRFIYVGGKELNDVGDLPHCHSCEFAWLPGNLLSSIATLTTLRNIRLLDLSYNCIAFLPNETFWSGLRLLQHVMVHGNRIAKAASYSGLSGAPALRILTLSNNPVAKASFYRSLTVSLCPRLLALDGIVIADDDLLPPTDPLCRLVASHRHSRDYSMPPVWRVGPDSDYTDHALAHLHQLIAAHRLRSCASPSLLVQRVFRGHIGRRIFRQHWARVHPAAQRIQRWLLRCYAQRRGLLAAYTHAASLSSNTHLGELLSGLPPCEAPSDPSNDHSVYFYPHDASRIDALVRGTRELFGPGRAPEMLASNYLCLAQSAAPSKTPFTRGAVVRRMHPFRRGQDLCRLLRIKARPTVLQVVSFSIVSRHGHKVTTAEKVAFWNSQLDGLRGEEALLASRRRLVRVMLASPGAVRLFLRLCRAVTSSLGQPLIRFWLPEAVGRLASVCAVQAAVRSHRHRRLLLPPLGTALMAVRAVRCLQRWWRWRVLRLRIRVLSALRRRVQGEGEATMYLIGRGLGTRLHLDARRGCVLRESKARFGYDAEGRVFMERGGDAGVGGRQPIPDWVEWKVEVNDEKPERAGSDPMGFADLVSLIEHKVKAEQVDCRGGLLGGLRVPKRRVTGLGSILQLTFDSAKEAHNRMALLMLHTWGPSRRNPVVLLSAGEARTHLAVVLLQAWYRGCTTRRWFGPLSSFLRRHLETSIFAEKRQAWAAKGARRCEEAYRPERKGQVVSDPSMRVDVSFSQYERGEGPTPRDVKGRAKHVMYIPGVSRGKTVNAEGSEVAQGEDMWKPPDGAEVSRQRDREEEEEEEEEEGVDVDLVLQLQADRLRLAGIKPASAKMGEAGHQGLQYQSDLAAACKIELEAESVYTRRMKMLQLEEQRRKNRVQRDTFAISNALRSRPMGFSLRILQKEGKYITQHREEQAAAMLRSRWQQQREAHSRAMQDAIEARRGEQQKNRLVRERNREENYEMILRERVRTAPPQIRPATANAALNYVKDKVQFSRAFQSTTNMIGHHVHRAEMERMHFGEARLASVRVQIAKGRRTQGMYDTRSEMLDAVVRRQDESRTDKVQRVSRARRRRLPSGKAVSSVGPSPAVATTRMAMDYPVIKDGGLSPDDALAAMPWGGSPDVAGYNRPPKSAPAGTTRPRVTRRRDETEDGGSTLRSETMQTETEAGGGIRDSS